MQNNYCETIFSANQMLERARQSWGVLAMKKKWTTRISLDHSYGMLTWLPQLFEIIVNNVFQIEYEFRWILETKLITIIDLLHYRN